MAHLRQLIHFPRCCFLCCSRQIQNPRVLSPVTGKPVAWKLMPGTPCPPLLAHVSGWGFC